MNHHFSPTHTSFWLGIQLSSNRCQNLESIYCTNFWHVSHGQVSWLSTQGRLQTLVHEISYNFHHKYQNGPVLLQRISIACYAKRCISYRKSVWPSVWPSVTRWYQAKMTQATITGSSLEDSHMTLVSSWLTSARNSKGNIGSEGVEW